MCKSLQIQLYILLSFTVGCSSLMMKDDGRGYFSSSAERVRGDAPPFMNPQEPSSENVDDVFMQSKADYHFTLAESYSLQDNPSLAVENYKMALVYDQKSPQIRYRLALEFVKLGLVSEAIAQCQEAINKAPDHRDASLLLGGLYSALHLYDQAMDQYQRVLQNSPNDMEASLFVGALYAEQGNFSKATSYLTKLSRRKGIEDKSQIWYYLGRIYSSQTKPNFANAESAYVTAIKLRPDFMEAVLALGGLYEEQEKTRKATRTYSNYQAEYGPHHIVAERLSQMYLNSSQLEKAHEQLKIVEAYDATNVNVSLKIALLLIEQKKFNKAVGKLESILQRTPSSEKVRFYLGALYEEMKNYRGAIQQFQTINFGSEYFEDAVMHAAYLFKLKGEYSSAIKEVERGLLHENDNPKYWVLQASLLDENKKIEQAKDVLENAVKKFPDNVQVNFQLGSLYDRMGRKDKTVEHMEAVLALDENHIQALNYLAYIYAESTRNLQAAEKLARKALSLQPGDGFIMDTLGWVLFKQDRVSEAVAMLEQAQTKEAKESVIAEHLGDAYFRYKLHTKARQMYQRAAELEKNQASREKINSKINTIDRKLASERGKTKRVPASPE